MAYGQPRASGAAAPAAQWAGSSSAAAAPSPVYAAAASPVDPMDFVPADGGRGASVELDGAVLARLEALESAVAGMGGGYDAGFAKGFEQGFTAGREAS